MGKAEIYKRDGGVCFYCHIKLTEDEATTEHLLSAVHGGNNDKNNLTIACKPHNTEAGAKSIVKKIAFRDELLDKAWAQPRRLGETTTPRKLTKLTVGDIKIEVEES